MFWKRKTEKEKFLEHKAVITTIFEVVEKSLDSLGLRQEVVQYLVDDKVESLFVKVDNYEVSTKLASQEINYLIDTYGFESDKVFMFCNKDTLWMLKLYNFLVENRLNIIKGEQDVCIS